MYLISTFAEIGFQHRILNKEAERCQLRKELHLKTGSMIILVQSLQYMQVRYDNFVLQLIFRRSLL